ncbi:MAG: hypothetical protein KC646_18160 [Candidatus Cloacimonetes bacterium]|nr:hypothetical protein [Candidatus Cloacimonadota bacterium]
MKIAKLTCVKYGDYYINSSNITFISSGEILDETGLPKAQQIYIHFSGGVESTMLYVADIDESIKKLNA